MDSKQNPFSLYDFLGYFTPGAMFLYCTMGLYAHVSTDTGFISSISENLPFDKAEVYIPFVLTSYIIGHLLSYLSSVTIERYSVWTIGYPSKYLMGYKCKPYYDVGNEHKKLRISIRTIAAIVLVPISFWDWLLGQCARYRDLYAKPLDKLSINIIRAKMVSLLNDHSGMENPPKGLEIKKTDFFRFVYHYAVEHAPNHLPKMQNYVAIYGFLRTITLISVAFFWGTIWHIAQSECFNWTFVGMSLGVSFLSFLFYMSFIKFYRRFSLEAFMALSAVYEVKTKYDADNWE